MYTGLTGTFELRPVRAEIQRKTTLLVRMDPFVVVQRDHNTLINAERKKYFTKKKELGRTAVDANGHKSPAWSDVIGVPDFADESPDYFVKVYDSNKMRPDVLIGDCRLDLTPCRDLGLMKEMAFDLRKKDEPAGKIFITITYLKGV